MLPTPSPLRPTRADLVWVFGPLTGALLILGIVAAAAGAATAQRSALFVALPITALAFSAGRRAPRPRGAPAPAALAQSRVRGQPAWAVPPVYRLLCPRLGGLLAYSVVVFGFPVIPWGPPWVRLFSRPRRSSARPG